MIGFVESNGRKWIMDMWTTGYLAPILENSQDLSKTEGKIEDGILTLKFSRPRNTNDNQDVAFTDDKGLYMIFPVKGIYIHGGLHGLFTFLHQDYSQWARKFKKVQAKKSREIK